MRLMETILEKQKETPQRFAYGKFQKYRSRQNSPMLLTTEGAGSRAQGLSGPHCDSEVLGNLRDPSPSASTIIVILSQF